ncbi:unnamed protein product [Pleuronectes platessa]|uniref:Uncharacterized protein n=1 Tax=Pleuronectes platessa TaxID=8262 RepID=A0A9N7V0P3_PLEPL|nr:unnamed protein product [Pleuronectes platessa]
MSDHLPEEAGMAVSVRMCGGERQTGSTEENPTRPGDVIIEVWWKADVNPATKQKDCSAKGRRHLATELLTPASPSGGFNRYSATPIPNKPLPIPINSGQSSSE